jgi:hypothetical protein
MFDLPYLVTHPLAGLIYRRHAELMLFVQGLAVGSKEREAIARRSSGSKCGRRLRKKLSIPSGHGANFRNSLASIITKT